MAVFVLFTAIIAFINLAVGLYFIFKAYFQIRGKNHKHYLAFFIPVNFKKNSHPKNVLSEKGFSYYKSYLIASRNYLHSLCVIMVLLVYNHFTLIVEISARY